MKKIEYWINEKYFVEEDKKLTIYQTCFEKQIDIPCLCYHESLSIAGNCRMCLVELNTSLKLIASCAMPISNGIKINTETSRVLNARESVLEFLLINHPLECPVCDQGGECDLQDLNKVFGSDKSRYYEFSKRAVVNKQLGNIIKTEMTRCIHCTRCVRFFNEISGINDLGMLNRGSSSEISTYISNYLNDELSGNAIDLCPVGALTSQSYAFKARPWELNPIESIDIMDSICSNIRIDTLNNKVYRILPIYSKSLNEDWISNKTRFFFESNDIQRLTNPLFKNVNGKYLVISWVRLFYLFFFNLSKFIFNLDNILAFSGNFSDFIEVNVLKNFFNSIGSELYFCDFFNFNSDFRENFYINNLIVNLENNIFFIFFCVNLRVEFPVLNSRLRKLYLLNDNLKFFGFGINSSYLNLPIKLYGNSIFNFFNLLKSKNIFNIDIFFSNYNYCIFNFNFLKNKVFFFFGLSFFFFSNKLYFYLRNWINLNFGKFFGVLFPYLGYLSYFENGMSFNKFLLNDRNFLFLHNVDDFLFLNKFLNKDNFIVYSGSFFDYGASISNLIVPNFTFFENNNFFFNIEMKKKKNLKIINNNNKILSFSSFIEFLSILKKKFDINNFSIFFDFSKVIVFFEFFLLDLHIPFYNIIDIEFFYFLNLNLSPNYFLISSNIINYYKNDVYSKNSKTLNLASFDYLVKLNIFF